MKLRLKIIECIQGISLIALIITGTLVLGGTEYQEEWSAFVWQFRTGLSYILINIIVMGCMELLKRFELYLLQKKYDQEWIEIFEDIEKAQQRSCHSKLGK